MTKMADPPAWDLVVARDDLATTRVVEHPVPEPRPDEVLLRVDRVGVTANNVTYALVGEAMNYWNFFPTEPDWGRVPVWGFAEVAASDVDGVEVGTRLYGYLPMSSHLVVRPERIDASGFRDASEHRADLPLPYNVYTSTTGDPNYESEREDLQILYLPLFFTSFMLDDFLADNEGRGRVPSGPGVHAKEALTGPFFGAETLVMSSASSKTAYGTSFLLRLRDRRPQLIGLTSSGNVGFTQKLGCYDEVLTYEDVTNLATGRPTLYADFAGSVPLRETLHAHLGDALVHDAIVGTTHRKQASLTSGNLPGPQPVFFFAPDQIRKRREDWGREGIAQRYGAAWRAFAPVVEDWVDVTVSEGPQGLRDAWLEVLSGRSDPRVGHVVQL